MKIVYGMLGIFIFWCATACSNKKAEKQLSDIWKGSAVLGKVIKIKKCRFEEWLEITPTDFVVPYGADLKQISAQPWDRDGDGSWDFLLMDTTDLAKINEFKVVSDNTSSKFQQYTNVRLGKKDSLGVYSSRNEELRPNNHIAQQKGDYLYQAEGPIWENEIIGFRLYFDERNGIDIFGKQNPEMVADKIGVAGNYHELQEWGMDVLKVGNSYGAGEMGIMINDTLEHIGDVGIEKFYITANGPFLASFTINYEAPPSKKWSSIKREILIVKGLSGYFTENQLLGGSSETFLTTGTVNILSDTLMVNEQDRYVLLTTHGQQAELNKFLGMGLVIPEDDFKNYAAAPNSNEAPVSNTYYASFKTHDEPINYLFIAGWELENSNYTDPDFFNEQCEIWAAQYMDWLK